MELINNDKINIYEFFFISRYKNPASSAPVFPSAASSLVILARTTNFLAPRSFCAIFSARLEQAGVLPLLLLFGLTFASYC